MPFYTGKTGHIRIGTSGGSFTVKPLTDWSLDIKVDEIDVTNFTSSGWKEVQSGIFSCDITASGPYDTNNVGVTQGSATIFSLDLDAGGAFGAFTGSGLVTNIKIDNSVKDVAKITYTATSNGPWTVSL